MTDPTFIQPGRRYKTRSGLTVTIACLSVTLYEGSIEGVYTVYGWHPDGRFSNVTGSPDHRELDLVEEVTPVDDDPVADTGCHVCQDAYGFVHPPVRLQSDPFEPDWDHIPSWCSHTAVDDNGKMYGFNEMPVMRDGRHTLPPYSCGGCIDYLKTIDLGGLDWKQSLRQRPVT